MIIHADLDAFYASLEEARQNLHGKPLAICMFTKDGKSGAVATANYNARALGLRSGMPLFEARQKAPDAIYLQADKPYYEQKSEKIMELFEQYGKVEKASIDEAYIEVKCSGAEALEKGKEIKHEIRKKFGINATVGIGKNILLAKIASKVSKPDGLKYLESMDEISEKNIELIPGIGEKTAEKLRSIGIGTVGDLIKTANENNYLIIENFKGKSADMLFEAAQGKAREHIEEAEKGSTGKIITLKEQTSDREELTKSLNVVVDELHEKITKEDKFFSKIILMLFLSNGTIVQKSRAISPTKKKEDIYDHAYEMLEKVLDEIIYEELKIRRLGVFVSFSSFENQATLFEFK